MGSIGDALVSRSERAQICRRYNRDADASQIHWRLLLYIYRIQGSRARALQRARSSVSGIHRRSIEDAWRIEQIRNLYQYMLPFVFSIHAGYLYMRAGIVCLILAREWIHAGSIPICHVLSVVDPRRIQLSV